MALLCLPLVLDDLPPVVGLRAIALKYCIQCHFVNPHLLTVLSNLIAYPISCFESDWMQSTSSMQKAHATWIVNLSTSMHFFAPPWNALVTLCASIPRLMCSSCFWRDELWQSAVLVCWTLFTTSFSYHPTSNTSKHMRTNINMEQLSSLLFSAKVLGPLACCSRRIAPRESNVPSKSGCGSRRG